MRALWLINPATVTPFAVAAPAAVFFSDPGDAKWMVQLFGLNFLFALAAVIVWLPIAGPVLNRLPGRRFAPLVFGVGSTVTALVVGGLWFLLTAHIPKVAANPGWWMRGAQWVLFGGYFGLVATLCLYIDPRFRAPPQV